MQIVANTLIALAFLCLWIIQRKRIRRLWHEIFSIRREVRESHQALTILRKEFFLSQLKAKLRLPARLPSEAGEEIILYNLFGKKNTGFFLEVGAYNGIELSNTYFLEALGWNGILIEPDPALYQQCVRARPFSKVINVAASDRLGTIQFTNTKGMEWLSFSGENKSREDRISAAGGSMERIEVPCITLDEILRDIDQQIDFISIDVEGHELEVLRGLDIDRFAPRVIIIEQEADAYKSPVTSLLNKHGYFLKLHLGSNSFYTRNIDEFIFSFQAIDV